MTDRAPLPGDDGFRDFLNRAYWAGQLTHREWLGLQLLHDDVWRSKAAVSKT